jgi:uncharacterized membrane protein YfcA
LLDLLVPLVLAVVGLGAGILGSLIGLGGGLLMTPALTFLGLTPGQISGTSLFAVTFASASSTITYSKQKKIRYDLALKISIVAIPGAISGAFISSLIELESFKLYFGILLILTVIYLFTNNSLIREKGTKNGTRFALSRLIFYSGAFGAGMISSIFGIGGGIIFVPLLILVIGMTVAAASPTSQLALFITSFTGTVTHAILGHPDYFHAGSLAAGAFFGGQIGARISNKVGESLLRKLFSGSLLAVAAKLISDFLSQH